MRVLYVYICVCSYVHVNVCIHCAGGLVSCLSRMRVYICVQCIYVFICVCTCECMYTLRRRARFSRSTMGLFYGCIVCIHMCMFMCTFECMYILLKRARFSRFTMRLFYACTVCMYIFVCVHVNICIPCAGGLISRDLQWGYSMRALYTYVYVHVYI